MSLPSVNCAPESSDAAAAAPGPAMAPDVGAAVCRHLRRVADPAFSPTTGPQMPQGGSYEAYGLPEADAYPEPAAPAYNPMAGYEQTYQAPQGRKRGRDHFSAGGFDLSEMANQNVIEIHQDQVRKSVDQIDPDFLAEQRAIAEGKANAKVSARVFNRNTGEIQMVSTQSKTAKRKHQIHTLAVQAKEREFTMQNQKGKFLQTKAQTQAKYGW